MSEGTIKQLKEVRRTDPAVRRTDGPGRETESAVVETDGLIDENASITTVPLMALVVGAGADLLRKREKEDPSSRNVHGCLLSKVLKQFQGRPHSKMF